MFHFVKNWLINWSHQSLPPPQTRRCRPSGWLPSVVNSLRGFQFGVNITKKLRFSLFFSYFRRTFSLNFYITWTVSQSKKPSGLNKKKIIMIEA
ncbi:hypothetical protein GvMRE_Ic4gS513 [endosymbiont GvMRE of Glomus versiforme]|nr:hypothetical protein GvMRE_Ic4gS513 [endosymbiont GvMRE of Glomus versiforme]